jgi:hypothetical protein
MFLMVSYFQVSQFLIPIFYFPLGQETSDVDPDQHALAVLEPDADPYWECRSGSRNINK